MAGGLNGGSKVRNLSEEWNRLGRDYFSAGSSKLKDFHEGRAEGVELGNDPRTAAMASDVIAHVERLSREGRWQEARAQFDPAHEPFIPLLQGKGQSLPCALILGPDEFLLRRGAAHQSGDLIHIRDDRVTTLPNVSACAISRDRQVLLTVTDDSFRTSYGLHGVEIAEFPWPLSNPCKLDDVVVANNGRRIAFADDDAGVWVGTSLADGVSWARIYPTEDLIAEARNEGYPWNASMTHCALSSDGRFIAYGSQNDEHFLDELSFQGSVNNWARIGQRSEYPHNACFSDDGEFVAFNSCHFYNGATIGATVAEVKNLAVPEYDEHPRIRLLNSYLRVYASTWLPAEVIGVPPGGFALCGVGFVNCVTPHGRVILEQYFGSSASAVDYCPITRRLIISSYSGFLHVYDMEAPELDGLAIGFNPRRELYRWVLWNGHDPFKW